MTTWEIVLGPPGTGKTTTLLGYVDDELKAGTRPDRIGYLSFTKKAVNEAMDRACIKFDRKREELPYFRTLHSLCFRVLGLGSADVMEGKRLQEFSAYAGVRITGRFSEAGDLWGFDKGDRILFMENLARVRGISLKEQFNGDNDDMMWNEVERVAKALRDFKEDRNIMDYTDMLLEFVKRGGAPRLDVLIIDEVQDLSWAQWQVIRALARTCRRVVIAGDDDQAIYRWAGADIDQFITCEGNARVLGQSWRVPVEVQKVAARPLAAIRNRRPKHWEPRRGDEGTVDNPPGFTKADLTGSDILVLGRNDYVLRSEVEPWLRRHGIIYEKHGHPAVKQTIIDAIVWWERLRRGETINGIEARAVYDKLASGTGVARGFKTLPAVKDEDMVSMGDLRQHHGLLKEEIWHESLDRIAQSDKDYMLTALRHGEKLTKKPRVRVSTIHGAKGGEAEHVILLTEMAQRTYAELTRNPQDEARVWYVAATRAKQRLSIVRTPNPRRCPWL